MWVIVLIVVVLVAIGVYVFVLRKPEETPQLPEPEEEMKLKAPERKPASEEKKAKPPETRKEKPAEAKPKPEPKPESKPEPKEEKKPKPAEPEAKKPEPKVEAQGPAPAPEPVAEKRPEPAAPAVEAAPEKREEPKPEPEVPAIVGQAVPETAVARRARDVGALRKGLGKAREEEGFFGRLAKLITGRKEIEPTIVDDLEEVLITSDVGVGTTQAILERIRSGLGKKELGDSEKVWAALREEAKRILTLGHGGLVQRTKPTVVLLVGVNGSGKTTTIGKLATQLKGDGRKVVFAAGDTFRAAAVQQLEVWGKRVGCEVVKGKDGSDPSSVVFNAIQAAANSGADFVLADTAGRLHTKSPLMDELKKIARSAGKAMTGAPHEILLVLDATNGQNALAQSRQFAEALPLTGIVLTKLDGTAKGGMVLGICDELKVPVRYIGIGERPDDLRAFDPDEFVEALLGDGAADDDEAA